MPARSRDASPPGDLREQSFDIALSHQDRLRVRFTLQRGEAAEIMVQLESQINGHWYAVRRYDTAHGSLHVHRKPWDKETDRREPVYMGGLNTALTTVIQELKTDWERLRSACESARAKGEADEA